jgi:hypothetical protein
MAKAVIEDVKSGYVKKVFTDSPGNAVIRYSFGRVKINDVLPFRIKFTNIGIESYGPGNPAPVGIAIIGLNNYIL